MITNIKYLGVQIDSQLNWGKHIDNIKTKANNNKNNNNIIIIYIFIQGKIPYQY